MDCAVEPAQVTRFHHCSGEADAALGQEPAALFQGWLKSDHIVLGFEIDAQLNATSLAAMQLSCESREISHKCISGLCPEQLNAGYAEGKLIIKQGSGKLLRMESICGRTECDLLMSTDLHIKPLFFSSLEMSRQHVKKLIFWGFSAISMFPLWHILLNKGQKSKAFMYTRGRKG